MIPTPAETTFDINKDYKTKFLEEEFTKPVKPRISILKI